MLKSLTPQLLQKRFNIYAEATQKEIDWSLSFFKSSTKMNVPNIVKTLQKHSMEQKEDKNHDSASTKTLMHFYLPQT